MHIKLIIITLFLPLISSTIYAQGFLKASGKVIIDASTNQEVYLRGMGLGGWLVPEGYMLLTSGFANSPTQIRNNIEALIGKDNTEEYYKVYRENYVNKIDIARLAEWGFNSVRLPLHYEFFTPKDQPGTFIEDGFIIIDSVLDWCKESQVYLILDLHAAPGAQNTGGISDSDGEARLWTDTSNQTRTVELWRRIAERYADEEWIGGYDLINETAYDLGLNNIPLRNLFIRITDAIRQVDKNHILFIEGNWYATDFSGLTPPWDDNMVYSFHKYWNETNTSSIQYLLSIRNSYNVPLWLGETGENSNAWFNECIELMEANNIGWAWWPHKKISSIAGPLSSPVTAGYQTLLNYWSGSGSKPSVEFAKNALLTQAKYLHIDSCIYQKDVIDALFRQTNNNSTIPFYNHIIPGRIYGTDYDLGKKGYAYNDKDYKNVNGQGGSTYNSGWSYRNDGVDIERCSDHNTNGFNVGWIDTGDWLNYTVDVSRDGNYNIKLRTAASVAGGKLIIRLNGEQLGDIITVPLTGGWQNWETILIENIPLTSGVKTLQLQFFFGGFNFNFIEFEEVVTGVKTDDTSPESSNLHQNYPNPFNPETVLSFNIGKASFVNLSIYDILGKKIATLVNEEKAAGEYKVNFSAEDVIGTDGNELSSGVYFYKISAGNFTSTKSMVLLR